MASARYGSVAGEIWQAVKCLVLRGCFKSWLGGVLLVVGGGAAHKDSAVTFGASNQLQVALATQRLCLWLVVEVDSGLYFCVCVFQIKFEHP